MKAQTLAIIGGSGLYEMGWLEDIEEVSVATPYGLPSDAILRGRVRDGEATVLFIPRHGRGHRFSPSTINYRANICALKMLGATHVLSVSAVGSLREEIAPGSLVIVDQFVDLTKRRTSTFFDEGIVAHVAFADPTCPILADAVQQAAQSSSVQVHKGGTYVCIEGPQFSSRAESQIYRGWGAHVIGMTNMPEAKLAREAELPYVTLALVTDYDCWSADKEAVSMEAVVEVLNRTVGHAREIARALAHTLPDVSTSPAQHALKRAIITTAPATGPDARARLEWLLGRRA
ncbi:S-methyl-5'-thioadenosine phosphorylase [Chondromyces apiculatus]|uniref:S-methyl-5'-thioadenosine phosphorylase n=1 Tax=Chondromyces apiculatus DSM 436 TaxID=1192034 RepID=A0A017TGZ5_9BACT|nr:S-methyl-5'-thioadenosine phosphorylase [Chondromyces apiculatus]EYF07896.1 5'-methylthioadenosine phosphorylase [Chondromyces apiculatus DSM 436]